ncbi:S-methyl-5-thioribose-1-phosphate isomerase [Catenovulum sp. 2E275]|uniref:S-methyl-5-thioribose-1-phosphate isomerase n=1 Tax=Catenovulum sp. 2E275 TaxID=2980497 RepID=UPI0021D08B36|nr:S-methyl-5-thioribose-1-phosphate isomerase [Catenovulum sp. 2E275]MCU4675191.1 S-methyl-5-thioribose-1-phosphate isomerase [Catenovulum sp. 2E275]
MKNLIATSLKYQNAELYILDQRHLPHQSQWHKVENDDQLIAHIKSLAIRGAPLIGIAAAIWIGHLAEQGANQQTLLHSLEKLRASRPTAVNLMNYLDRLKAAITAGHLAEKVSQISINIFEEDIQLCRKMAQHGAELVKPNAKILTHCNTGSLATAGVGTAIGVITTAHQQNKNIQVWVDETRPLLQGGRLTAWEMEQAGVAYKIICDSMAACLMAQGEVDMILVGADRIAANGDFANKVGTYSLAVLAHYHNVPFYVVAPSTTVDPACPNGQSIPIEQRDPNEIKGINAAFGSVSWSPEKAAVYNPAFDVTPAKLVTGWILESGVYNQNDIQTGVLKTL